MQTVRVKVNGDHLKLLATAKKPIIAVSELIWNGLDADASRIDVVLQDNGLNTLDRLTVRDDGHGLPYEDALLAFSNLGGSWKRQCKRSKGKGRLLHGRLGKGRFRAFAIGSHVRWDTCFLDDEQRRMEYSISGVVTDPTTFHITDPKPSEKPLGTEVSIDNILKNWTSLKKREALNEVASYFGPYLVQYPDAKIYYNGKCVEAGESILAKEEIPLPSITDEEGV